VTRDLDPAATSVCMRVLGDAVEGGITKPENRALTVYYAGGESPSISRFDLERHHFRAARPPRLVGSAVEARHRRFPGPSSRQSLWTVSIENAARQTAMYSSPSTAGVE
jgi:hypothetical protein